MLHKEHKGQILPRVWPLAFARSLQLGRMPNYLGALLDDDTLPPPLKQPAPSKKRASLIWAENAPRTVTETYTHPVVTVTERSTLPKAYETVRVTRPRETVTETEKVTPVTKTVTETVSGTPVEKTVVETPPAKVITTTREGEPTTVTETVSDTPVVVTKPASTVTATRWATPTRTVVKDGPGGVVTETKTITPEPVTSTRVIPVTENYYTEKVYESVKEVYEYYYFAGFTKNDKSKTIELPDGVKGSWTFEVIKGRDIVVVERTEDGKLTITPRPDFEGEGDVEILITDELGNQYIYRVKVSDTVTVQTQTNVKVNNFFYTINPDSENRIKVIEKNSGEKTELVWIDADGNEHEVLPGDIEVIEDEQQVKVEVKDPNLRGQVVVKIVEESGNVRENIVTIENTTSKFDVVREIPSTSTTIVERRGGDYTIKSGEELVEITEGENDTWVIKPKDKDTEGTVEIVFTDEKGVEYNYTIEIKNDVNSGPAIRNYEIQSGSDGQDGDTVKIERRDEWDIKVVSGDVDVEATTGKLDENGDDTNIWTVKPRDGFTGQAVIHIVDKKTGTLVGVWNIQVNPGINQDQYEVKPIEERDENGDVINRYTVNIIQGKVLTTRQQRSVIPENGWTDIPAMNNAGKFIVVSGNEYVTTSTVDGEFRVTAKPDTVGKVVRVEELNDNGGVLRTITLDIVPADTAQSGPLTESGASIGYNNDLPQIKIDNSTTTGEIKIELPEGLKDFVPTQNDDQIEEIIKTGEGKYTLKMKDGARASSATWSLMKTATSPWNATTTSSSPSTWLTTRRPPSPAPPSSTASASPASSA